MPIWIIQQREAGDPLRGPLGWVAIGQIEAPNPTSALHEFFIQQQWYANEIMADHAVVHGVGHFRASLDAQDPALLSFTIQRQDPIGPDDRHLTWSDVATVEASDADSALQRFLESLGGVNVNGVHGHVANLVGLGSVRAVPAERADSMRVTPEPRLDEPL